MPFPISNAKLLLVAAILAAGSSARAESAFELSYPLDFGRIPAITYDERGERIGEARVVIESLEDGQIRMATQSASREGARTEASAWFAPVEPSHRLRLIRQESSSLDPEGHSLGHLVVDHLARQATCKVSESEDTQQIALPPVDRIVNVPMNLLFMPLVRGETRSLKFQLFLCRDGARTMNFEAWVRRKPSKRSDPIEVRYAPDFGSVVSLMARGFAPRLSFWFDPSEPHGWLGHRLPLYSGGPEVLVVRDGISAGSLAN
ncbi:MAG: hypothetical protein OEY15_12255 [Myxococcales bacterium]|nr:hypothetical protein [Myxococcales bacterium]